MDINAKTRAELAEELEHAQKKIEELNGQIIALDHENREFKSLRGSLERLSQLEQQLDSKDQELAEALKKGAVQEEAIASWAEVVEGKDKELAEKDEQMVKLRSEIE